MRTAGTFVLCFALKDRWYKVWVYADLEAWFGPLVRDRWKNFCRLITKRFGVELY